MSSDDPATRGRLASGGILSLDPIERTLVRAISVSDCHELLRSASGTELERLIRALETDSRTGVRHAVAVARRRLERHAMEIERLRAMNEMEARLRSEGFSMIAGLDEVGRGALAGPVTAAAVVLPTGTLITGLDDSKRLSPSMRILVVEEICSVAVAFAVAHMPAHVVDSIGISQAVFAAMDTALSRLGSKPDHAITDGLRVGLPLPETAVVGGDSSVASVAAASVLAKVTRDRLMAWFAMHYPEWMFESNKGYGTSEHLERIASAGLSPIHRRSYAPCAATLTLF